MRNLHSKLLLCTTYLASISLLFACKPAEKITGNHQDYSPEDVKYSIIYVIHGDADYLYHDSLSRSRQADEEVLAEAKRLGQNAKSGEVLIFHQRPEKKILWLFPKKDRHFFHYKNGTLKTKIDYSPSSEKDVFSTETELLNRFRSTDEDSFNNIFLYFGHEIPYRDGEAYHTTMPEINFNTENFAKGLSGMLPNYDSSFDLTVLSTCNNGSPDMVNALHPYTQTLLASPQNLHLSHIDTGMLSVLETKPDIKSEKLASILAEETYNRLSRFIQTVISLTVYDLQQVSDYISEVDSLYQDYLYNGPVPDSGTDNTDCASLPIFKSDFDFSRGLTVWYRAPRFGTKAGHATHSGWGCKISGNQ